MVGSLKKTIYDHQDFLCTCIAILVVYLADQLAQSTTGFLGGRGSKWADCLYNRLCFWSTKLWLQGLVSFVGWRGRRADGFERFMMLRAAGAAMDP